MTTDSPAPKSNRNRNLGIGCGGLILLFFLCGIVNSLGGSTGGTPTATTDVPASTAVAAAPDDTAEPVATDEPTAAPTKDPNSFTDGTLLVGSDIQPGRYRTDNASGSCYWSRLSGIGGSLDEIISNDNAIGPSIVDIAASDMAFESTRCDAWTLVGPATGEPATTFGDGVFIVGADIAPGQYRSSGGDGCYWARLSDFTGSTDGIIANDNADGQAIVAIAATDAGFKSARCGEWAPLP